MEIRPAVESDLPVLTPLMRGYCDFYKANPSDARLAVLEDLFVAPEARGKGAADALIEAVAERARRHGAPVVTWLTAPDNHRAQAVYNRVGGTSGTFLE